MTVELTVTTQQGQHILNYVSGGLRMPEKIGEVKYEAWERANLDDALLALRKVMLSYSNRMKKPKGLCFGGIENWEVQKGDACAKCGSRADQWVMVDEEETVKIRLEDEAAEGLYWVLFLMAHPESPYAAGIIVLDETAWPLTKMLEKDRQLAKDIGLGGKRPRKILSNEEFEKQERKSADKAAEGDKKA